MFDTLPEGFPLSRQQRRVALLDQGGRSFCAQCALLLRGELDRSALESAVAQVIERHEILRTTFHRQPGLAVPLQVVRGEGRAVWERLDPALLEGAEELDLEALFRRQRQVPFDLENGPVLRLALTPLAERGHLLVITLPALCADAAALARLAIEIAAAYGRGTAAEDAEEPLQYIDLSEWQEEVGAAEDEESCEGRAFWDRQAGAAGAPLGLPFERTPGPARRLFEPRAVRLTAGPRLGMALAELSRQQGIALPALLLAGWSALLWRLSGRDDLTLGAVFDGRRYDRLESVLGPVARHLPLRAPIDPRRPFRELAERFQELLDQGRAWQEYGAADDGFPGDSFAAAWEHTRWPSIPPAARLRCEPLGQSVLLERFTVKLAGLEIEGRLELDLLYDPAALSDDAARGLAKRLELLLRDALAEPSRPIADLEILTPDELRPTGPEGNASGLPDLPVPRLFARQVARVPQRVALVCEDRELTYAELDARVERLARRLCEAGVGPETRVALALDRSAEIVIALLAVLRTGGAYVPLEPGQPAERTLAILNGARVGAVIASSTPAWLPAGVPCLGPGEGPLADGPAAGAAGEVELEQAAYVLFTSGSTGTPKGVVVEHRQLLRYVQGIVARMDLPDGASFAVVSTFAADLGLTVVLPALCTGGCLHVLTDAQTTDADAFAGYVGSRAVDALKIVPSHLRALLAARRPEQVLPRQLLVLGGEALSWDLLSWLESLTPACRVMNHYGPTETTVGVLSNPLSGWRPPEAEPVPAAVPLGTPLPNAHVFLLDPRLQPVPAGVVGEVFIGGETVSRGYLARPDLTAERFLPDFLSGASGGRLYRSGDRARLLPGGEIEFLGRVDHQVKLRGFRIELGEVEAALRRHPGVRDAVAALRRGEGRPDRLVAWFVPREEPAPREAELRAHLARLLPEVMVPAAVVPLAAFPLTPNGKTDRAALPEPGREETAAERPYTAPRSPAEEVLARIWGEVLRVDRVSVFDNFFELGGDSILAIQVIAKANQAEAGLSLAPNMIFKHQTIAELAAAGTGPRVVAEQGMVAGDAPLTPIQRWLFERAPTAIHHWNQSVLFAADDLEPAFLDEAVRRLLAHHDALRVRFEMQDGEWRQRFIEGTGDRPLLVIDMSALGDAAGQNRAIEEACSAVQTGFDLGSGCLLRSVLFQGASGRPDHFLFAVHHLVMDAVSWRILVDDFQTLYEQLREGKPGALPAKTTSFKEWAGRLREQVREGAWDHEIPVWTAVPAGVETGVPVDRSASEAANTEGSAATVAYDFDEETTRALLQKVPAVYQNHINEVLLAVLLRAVAAWRGRRSLLIDLEGHGREHLFDDVDLSRTVGWFTTHFPVFLALPEEGGTGELLTAVREQLRRIPGHGIGWGLLRYLSDRPEVVSALAAVPRPEISFNYLGQLDQVLRPISGLRLARVEKGRDRSPRSERPYVLQVGASVGEGCLQVRFTYSSRLHDRASILELGSLYRRELRALIDHCQARAAEVAALELPLSNLDAAQLGRVAAALDNLDLEEAE